MNECGVTLGLAGMETLQGDIEGYEWMSEYLEESAEALEKMAGELIIRLEGKKNLYPRLRAADQ